MSDLLTRERIEQVRRHTDDTTIIALCDMALLALKSEPEPQQGDLAPTSSGALPDTSASGDLLPCPFCGGAAKFDIVPFHPLEDDEEPEPNAGGQYVICDYCRASTCLVFATRGDVKQQLIERWNKRATVPSVGHDPETASKPNSQTAVAVQSEPEGWVSVPREPTFEMKQAGGVAGMRADNQLFWEALADRVYKAMLSASPRVPELSVGEQKQEPKP